MRPPPMRRAPPCRAQAGAGPGSFGSEAEYAACLRPRLRPGARLVAVAGDRTGDCGPLVKDDGGMNVPLKVQWEKHGDSEWVNWRNVALEVRASLAPPQHPRARGARAWPHTICSKVL